MFIVATCKQKKNVAGHVELKHGDNEVYIEISDDLLGFNESVLATLAHEITHKYLHINNIEFVNEYENEVLTDITAVFLGLGKLMLNGCECKQVRKEKSINGTQTTTETKEVGYLKREQLAFVYRLICAMRKIKPRDYEYNLSAASINSLRDCERIYSDYFNLSYHETDAREKSLAYLRSSIFESQRVLSSIDKNLLYVQTVYMKSAELLLEDAHKKFNRLFLEAEKKAAKDELDPCLKFLSAKVFNDEIRQSAVDISVNASNASKYHYDTAKLAQYIQSQNYFQKPESDMFSVVTCRNDGTKLKLPNNKSNFIAKCPKCQYQFVVDTTDALFIVGKKNSSIDKLKLFLKNKLSPKLRKF